MPLLGVLGLGGGLSNTSTGIKVDGIDAFSVSFTGTVDDFETPAPDGRTYRNLVWRTPGSFTVTSGDRTVDVFVLGGGGAGGDSDINLGPTVGNFGVESAHNVVVGGGGGGGSYDQEINVTLPLDTYTVEVGDGGYGYNNDQFGFPAQGPGGNSSFSNTPGTVSYNGYGGNHGGRVSADSPNPASVGPGAYNKHGQTGGANFGIDPNGNRYQVPCPARGFPGNDRWDMDPDFSGGYLPYFISGTRPPTYYGQPETTPPPFIQKFEQVGTVGHSGAGSAYGVGNLRYTGEARRNANRATEFGKPYTLPNYNNPAPTLFEMDDNGMDGGRGFPAEDVVFGGWNDANRYASNWGGGGGGGYNKRTTAGGIVPGSWFGGRGSDIGGGGKGGAIYSAPLATPELDRVTGRDATGFGAGGGGGGVARFAYAVYQSSTNTGSSQGGRGGDGSPGVVVLRYISKFFSS